MSKIPRFRYFAHLAADATLINVVGGSVRVALGPFPVELPTRIANPIRILLTEDRLVVFAILVPVHGTGRVAFSCLT
jgi:hypothetical protein